MTLEQETGPVALVRLDLSFLHAVEEELATRLPAPQGALLALLGLSDFLVAMTVVLRERVAGRLLLRHDRIEPALELLRGLRAECRRSSFDFSTQRDVGQGTTHAGAFVRRGVGPSTHGIVYLGVSREFVAGAEKLEVAGEHRLCGRLFGYPDCCVAFFAGAAGGGRFDRTSDSIPHPGPFPGEMNPLLPHLYGVAELFHFPCSPDCPASRRIVRGRRRWLARHCRSYSRIEALGCGLALYGPELGSVLVTRYCRIDGRTYEVREAATRNPVSESLLGDLPVGTRIRVTAAHDFAIGSARYHGDSSFAALFL